MDTVVILDIVILAALALVHEVVYVKNFEKKIWEDFSSKYRRV